MAGKRIVKMCDEKTHLRHVMLYEFRKGVTVGTAFKNMLEVYHERALALRTMKKWLAKFRNGEYQLKDEPRSGRPSLMDDDVIVNLLENHPRMSTEEVAERVNNYIPD